MPDEAKIKTPFKRKARLVLAIIMAIFFLKCSFYDGVITCRPVKYRGTIIGKMLGYEGRVLKADLIPKGMPDQELLALLDKQGIKYNILHRFNDYPEGPYDPVAASRANFYLTYVPAPDYVIGFGVKFFCILGEYLPGAAVWIKDGKVYKTRFVLDRTFL